jgi:hypothetical protein
VCEAQAKFRILIVEDNANILDLAARHSGRLAGTEPYLSVRLTAERP